VCIIYFFLQERHKTVVEYIVVLVDILIQYIHVILLVEANRAFTVAAMAPSFFLMATLSSRYIGTSQLAEQFGAEDQTFVPVCAAVICMNATNLSRLRACP
jgi:hypothetical protein